MTTKPLLTQRLPLTEDTSFVAKTFRTPNFEVPWHQHIECEIILFTEGAGMSFVGNHVGTFNIGDIYFIGSNLPHTFQKQSDDLVTSAVVIQFTEDFWGSAFISLPESNSIMNLFKKGQQGLKISGNCKKQIEPLIQELENLQGFQRIISLCKCLQLIAEGDELIALSTQNNFLLNHRSQSRIDRIFQYTIDHFKYPITLEDIAKTSCMSVPAFCSFFKKSTKKTYVEFLNEIRIGYACKMLIDTDEKILNICYMSGYNTLAHFNKQFLKLKNMTPSQYRNLYEI